jgi:hypothetical protein
MFNLAAHTNRWDLLGLIYCIGGCGRHPSVTSNEVSQSHENACASVTWPFGRYQNREGHNYKSSKPPLSHEYSCVHKAVSLVDLLRSVTKKINTWTDLYEV